MGFNPGSPVTDSNIAFSLLLDADSVPGNPFSTTALPGGGHDLSIPAKILPEPTREILAACLERRAVWLIYAAKTGQQEFTFHPAAGVRARGRHHLRGYRTDGRDAWGGQLDDRYVDVVPARAVEAWPAVDEHFVDLTGDRDWCTFETLHFELSPALTEDERLCYEHEYGIADIGELTVEHRCALMPYVRQELMERRCWRYDGACVPIWKMKEWTGIQALHGAGGRQGCARMRRPCIESAYGMLTAPSTYSRNRNRKPPETSRFPGAWSGCGGRIRTCDLQVMSLP